MRDINVEALLTAINVAAENPNGDEKNERFIKGVEAFEKAYKSEKVFTECLRIGLANAANSNKELVDRALNEYYKAIVEAESDKTDDIIDKPDDNVEAVDELEVESESEPEEEPELESDKTEDSNQESTEKSDPKKLRFGWLILAMIVLAVAFFAIAWLNREKPESEPAKVSETTLQRVDQILQDAGWTKDQYVLDQDVDAAIDESTAGNRKFGDKLQSNLQMVAFLKSGTDGANALMEQVKKATGATEGAITNPSNWVSVQSKIDFVYPGNTFLKDGKVVAAGKRIGKAGDIFMMFVDPTSGKYISVRGACANPQTIIPQPEPEPIPQPEPWPWPEPNPTPEPKDPTLDVLQNDDVSDWKKNSNGEEMTVSKKDGATVANGLQKDPEEDAEEAAEAAEEIANELEEAHEDAVDAAVVVDDENRKDEVTPSDVTKIDPSW